MEFTPIGPATERSASGNVWRLHSSPQWMWLDGAWQPIDEAVSLTHDERDGSFTVRCKDGRWIRLDWTDECRQAVLDATVDVKTHPREGFGPQVNAYGIPERVSAQVTCSDGVVRQGGLSWTFDPDGVCGLHLAAWEARFPVEMDPTGKDVPIITLDLAGVKTELGIDAVESAGWVSRFVDTAKSLTGAALGAVKRLFGFGATDDKREDTPDPVIDLDPTVVTGTLGAAFKTSTVWATARDYSSGATASSTIGGEASKTVPVYVTRRGLARFDTSAISGVVTSSVLAISGVTGRGGGGGNNNALLSFKTTQGMNIALAPSYVVSEQGATLATFDTSTTSADVTASFAVSSTLDYFFVSDADLASPAPDMGVLNGLRFTGSTLTITVAAAAGSGWIREGFRPTP